MAHVSRLTLALRKLLHTQRVAALGTIDAQARAFVSMVPYAIDAEHGKLIIHVSGLAAHTRHLQAQPQVSLMVMQSEVPDASVHDLSRVTLQARAEVLLEPSPEWCSGRAVYLERFPDAEPLTHFGDFIFVALTVQEARQVDGFGSARTVDAAEFSLALLI